MLNTGPRFETFEYEGEQWTRFNAAPADEAFICGVDLGQSQDPTAIIVMRHTRTPLIGDDGWDIDPKKRTTRQKVKESFDVVHAERLPLGTSYPAIVEHIRNVLNRPPLRDNCYLVIDESGVGRAVGDMFSAAGLRAVRVIITAGTDVVKQELLRWSVAKSHLISGVDARLYSDELRFAAELTEAPALAEELKDFRRHVGAAGRATFQARVGKHDDLVLGVSLCVWWATERRKYRTLVGPLRGLY
jgi:hypothetical protein